MISIIVPTLGERKEEFERLLCSLENQSYKGFECIVVSQDNHEIVRELIKKYKIKCRQIELYKRGLSYARNEAFKIIDNGIVLFGDDDCWYEKDAMGFIKQYFEENNNYICCFQHYDNELCKYPKKYSDNRINNLNNRQILSQASIDIVVNLDKINKYNIKFDEEFGLGSINTSGEENIYLMDLKNSGCKVDYFPKIISYHPIKDVIVDKRFITSKRNVFKRLFGDISGEILFFMFILKKINIIIKHK